MGSGYQVIARRWRPRQFDEVVGQQHIVRTLKNAITSDRIAHAYLFVGPRGTGKTTMARIFAKALNAEGGPQVAPADDSETAQAIMRGEHLDVIEMDAASNRGVDEVQEIIDSARYAPTSARYKIYVIDEVHQLTQHAFNALLKTLEEPPAHVVFIFATTEKHKVLATIQSRCQRFDFQSLPTELIAEQLLRIAESEGIQLAPEAAQVIARRADGGMRDAQVSLDQAIAFVGEKVDLSAITELYQLVSPEAVEGLWRAILSGDRATAISMVAEQEGQGRDLNQLLRDLVEMGREQMRKAFQDRQPVTLAEGTEVLPEQMHHAVQVLHEGADSVQKAVAPRSLLELVLLRASEAAQSRSIDSLIRQLSKAATAVPEKKKS